MIVYIFRFTMYLFTYFRSFSESPKEVRRWRKRLPLKNLRTKHGCHPGDFRASTSALSRTAGHESRTLFNNCVDWCIICFFNIWQCAVDTKSLLFVLWNLVGTILETNDGDDGKNVKTVEDESSVDSNSTCSSCDSMSERSYELEEWRGKLSMSWESVASEITSSSLLLAPQSGQ